MLKNEIFNRPYVRDITKTCECACSLTCNSDIITNADRVRTMSDEELAGYLAEIAGGTISKMAAQLGIPLDQERNERYIDRLKEEYLKRLQQPAEKDTK